MKRVLFPLLLISVLVRAQTPNEKPGNLPALIPPSPEVASIVKAGNTSTSLFTGAASVSVPLYELSVGTLKIPIALSYSTGGTKVNEIPSRLGLNWSLAAGGSVSRVIHDEEDDGTNTVKLAPPNFNVYNLTLENYLTLSTMEGYDTEDDEYSFSVNGLSGKFFFDAYGFGRAADHVNMKITKTGNIFTITAGDGAKYEFGGINAIVEKTRDVKTAGMPKNHKIKRTTWFLTKITSPEGDEVDFHYAPIYTKTNQGPYQSVILKNNNPLPQMPARYVNCSYMCEEEWSPFAYSKIDYDTYYLTKITTSNGQQVYLTYQDRPDASGDNRLLYLNVYSTNNGSAAIKKYKFEYEDRTVGNDLNQRFFLKKVIQLTNETTPQTLAHEFQYNDPSSLPSQESLRQDYYGYSKGTGAEPANFFPIPVNYTAFINGSTGANRSPDFEATKAGTLKKVIYPTGGYEEFTYEPHTIVQNQYEETYTYNWTINVTGGGTSEPPGICDMTTLIHPFSLTNPQVKLTYTTAWNSSGPPPGSPNACNPDGIHFLSYLEIWDVVGNERVFEARHKQYEGGEYVLQLQPGVSYEMRLKAKGESTHAWVNYQTNPVVQTTTTNIPVCGLRVKKIISFDPLASKTYTKHYLYSSLQYPSRSSGVGVLRPSFENVYKKGGICYNLPPRVLGPEIAFCNYDFLQVSASSLSGMHNFNGSPVAYSHVIETTDEQMTNGGIEHRYFAVNNPQMPLPLLNYDIAGAGKTSAVPEINGTELETKVFKKEGGSLVTLKHSVNRYAWSTQVGHTIINNTIRKRWEVPTPNSPIQVPWQRVSGFDVNGYLYQSKWWHLDTTIITEYDQDGSNPVVKKVNYTYGNATHMQPTQISTVNSNNETVTQNMQYPADYSSTAPYGAMVNNHIITPVIESNTVNGTDPVTKVRNEYTAWTVGPKTFYKPQLVKVAEGSNALENRLQYYTYDQDANPLELSKEGDGHIAYLWNYQRSFPVAEVKNAAFNEIAYTSFEGDDNGNWTVTGATQYGGITGKRYLPSGSLSRTLANTSKPYTVTLWTLSTATVNSTAGTLLTTKNNWKLYRWNIAAGTSSVTVSGSSLDEVRLYPAVATMSTFTYEPFIGIASACDLNNKISYYTYDAFNRLYLVRDIDNNILKKVCYNYNGQQEICPTTISVSLCTNLEPDWQNTANTRCQLNAAGGYTGHVEQEQQDINSCSPTYGDTRWTDLGSNEEACPPTENINITSANTTGLSGYTALYTSRTSGLQYMFTISAASGSLSLGTVPAGAYDLVISKSASGILPVLLFGSGCSFVSGTSATFLNINISNCHHVTIDSDL